ncbi:MAG: carbon-nitrogen hydrolase [Acidobacteria bacterium]|nr:carbon-nitrogen hydrolase [Acidobacteriota bacterium]
MVRQVRLGLIQMRCGPTPDENLDKALQRIREAASDGAQLICLQELFRTQYFPQREDASFFDLAEPVPGPTTRVLCPVAQELGVALAASVFERRAPGIYHNTAVLIDVDGTITGTYRKMHIPDDPYFYEKFYFTPGDLGFQSHTSSVGNIGLLVCWDQWFPEAARLTALRGAQILIYPTAIGWLQGETAEVCQAQHSAWETIQRGHAVANGIFVAAVNRVGVEGKLDFWGQSFVCDPFGRILVKGAADREETLIVECDFTRIEETRRNWPFLRDRRIEAYGGISVRFSDSSQE